MVEHVRKLKQIKVLSIFGQEAQSILNFLLKAIYNRTDLVTVITLLLLNYNDTTLNVQDFSTY